MNLSNIPVTPHIEGFIKVGYENDPLFGGGTRREFVVTARHHEVVEGDSDPKLAPHPITDSLKEKTGENEGKIMEIPIRLFFGKAATALTIQYQAYSTPGNVPVCAGNGKTAMRTTRSADNTTTKSEVACPGPGLCDLVQNGHASCVRQVRLPVQIKGQPNPLTAFEVRTSSINTYRALRAQLQLVEKRFGGLRHVPLKLVLWQASNEASGFAPFSLAQLALDAKSEVEALQEARRLRQEEADAGLCDDFDSAFGIEGEDAAFEAAALDFQAARDFLGGGPARRLGTESPATALRAKSAPMTRLGAGAAIASAVLQSTAAAPAAEPAET
ncbi:hypothetical protein FN976_11330 [Caenimonas sedimenti]|uniref:Uncharacterized protein n=1 Tax=Caenimonas sedimenti TaxID=2596921 RepID=A0A562ZT33_9BURK|nr:hypothetical protein [Caenimonas sedimenti]TWO71498.1 hypothetical protein FN976_11330 [Caenimonas sedimenti]